MRAFITWASDSYFQNDNMQEIEIKSLDDLKRLYLKESAKLGTKEISGLIINFCESPESIAITVYDDYIE